MRVSLSAALVAVCTLLSGLGGNAQAGSSEQSLASEVLVKLARAADLTSVAADYALDPVPIDQFGSRPIYRLRILDSISPRDKAAALRSDPLGRVIYADPNFVEQAPEGRGRTLWAGGSNSGAYANQWAPSIIRLSEAHAVSSGFGITVAVLDTGVDATHPALAGRLVPGYDFVDGDNDPSEVGVYGLDPEFGHGTHVAGLVALVAPGARIMPVRVLDPSGMGNSWVLAEALAFAIDPDGDPNTNDGANVINLSLSSLSRSRLLRDVIGAITCGDPQHTSANDLPCFLTGGRGAVVAAAAGNSASSAPEYPAANGNSGLISVGASTQADTLAAFSNYGSWVNVAAPGQDIISTVPGGGFGTWSGTSMAAPLVAGEAALLRSLAPNLTTPEVVRQIISSSARISGQVPYRIDAASAVTSLKVE